MNVRGEERLQLALELKEIEHKDDQRKQLIRLCVIKAAYLYQKRTCGENRQSMTTNPQPTNAKPVSGSFHPATSQKQSESDLLQKKVQAFELQVNNLKLQLSTKEQAHAAKIDELQEEIGQLKKTSGAYGIAARSSTKSKLPRNRVKLAAVGSPVSRPKMPISLFLADSPFSELKTGRGNSFTGDGLASVASQASFKLSRAEPKPTGDVFSPNNSSAESTPRKSKQHSEEVQDPNHSRLKSPDKDILDKGAVSEALNASTMTVSDPEETFESANSTFESDKKKKSKKRKIRLVSSEASKLILALNDKAQDGEEEDLNSLNYYKDENFETESGSPARLQKRSVSVGPTARKKHVFKIG